MNSPNHTMTVDSAHRDPYRVQWRKDKRRVALAQSVATWEMWDAIGQTKHRK